MTIPPRLRRNGRPLDPTFAPDEQLYMRFMLKDYTDGMVRGSAFRVPVQSVNRAKYSVPDDVLLPDFADWGIAVFAAAPMPVPRPHPMQENKTYSLAVLHVPDDDNYSHSEVQGLLNGEPVQTVPESIKKGFRTDLAGLSTVLKTPSV